MVQAAEIIRRKGSVHPGLPHVTTENTSLAQWLNAASQLLGRVGAMQQAVDSLRNLGLLTSDGGLANVGGETSGIGIQEGPLGVPNLDVAPVPSGFKGEGGIGVAILFWDNPFLTYGNHAVTHVYRHTADEFNNAVEIGTSVGISYVDESPPDALDQTYFYWIRWETTDGMSGLGPPSESLEIEVDPDPAAVIARLTQEILADPLTLELLTPPAGKNTFEEAQRISDRVAARIAAVRARLLESVSETLRQTLASVQTTVGIHGADIAELEARFAGITLGPTINNFGAATRAEVELARNNYGAANPAWLASYDADDSLHIRLVYGVVQQYQNRVNAAWANVGEPTPTAAAVSRIDTATMQNAADIMTNASVITLLTGQIGGKADASALEVVRVSVEANDTGIAANTAAITQLQTDVTGKASTQAVQALQTEVDANETGIAANSAAVTGLQTSVAGKADATAVATLGTTVTSQGDSIDALTAQITALESTLVGRTLGPEANMFMGDTITAAAEARDAYATANPMWLQEYDDNSSLNIVLTYGVLQQYQNRSSMMWSNNGDPVASAAAISQLNTQVTEHDGEINANAASITSLQATLSEARELGPETNEFAGMTEAEAEAARNAYASANPAWLQEYDDDATQYILLEYD